MSDKVACHAHLYVFADRFIIKPLKDLCLHKLHRDLNCLKLNKETVSEVVVMLVYAYMNTSGNAATEVCESGTGVGKELRELVLAYAVEKVDDLVRYAAFKDMMIDGGELAADITCATAERWISVVED
ncbi:uncharacterized protein HMPREF1541_10271 [Cyphellophora europaea CBS 101466]|uniref:BTB domain-containing protein n=1 Tax=Cyphellophora europaea (strain CBS 101466) TaxID=1220924 RepID=W2S7B6_CYPE1|nr:uncharacterized protein HMPREF1541_10271 [Cyphellophora europaea CBS 101466]ETN44601.1 hypothetical protein HMPREF1541_10271 [Cyphellophora europaea CBS 101466]